MTTITVAKHSGFCFGVRHIDTLATEALSKVESGHPVYSYGPIVHNPPYVKRREEEGLQVLKSLEEGESLDEKATIVLRAHGVLKEEREILEKTGATLIDGTCPILLSIYRMLEKKESEGYRCLIVGDPKHPEVRAMRSYLASDALIVSSVEEAQQVRSDKPLFVVSQTTNRPEFFSQVCEALDSTMRIEVHPTICEASRKRQKATAALAKESDVMVVIGGSNSSNTEKLRQVAATYCPNVQKIETLDDYPLHNLKKFDKLGVTAGASTPDWIIEEVVRGMENFTKEDFMEQIEDSMVKIFPRDIVKGTVIAVKDDEVYVDIHYRADGIIRSDEMTDDERKDTHACFHEGDEIDVYVVKLDDGEGNVMLSTRRVEGLKNWEKLVEKYEAGEVVDALITGENRGGLVASVMGINGFIPASQIATYFVKNFKQYVGQTLKCKFLSIDERKRRVVLSARAVLEDQLDEVWEKIVVGEKVKGKVVRMTDFGAFVDLGGADGLIHVSDISWQRIEKPSDVLEIGQEVEPLVLKASRERNRISLGLKQLQPKPFELFKQNHKPGDLVKGTVVNLLDFGAFVRLEEGVEGLIHVSQISHHHVEKPSDEFNVGQEVEVKILEIDDERQRIALSTRAVEEPVLPKHENEPEKVEGESAPRQYDASRFERKENKTAQKPKAQRPARESRRAQSRINFDSSDDIGTNLGDLIAAQMNLVGEDPENLVQTAEDTNSDAVETPEVAEKTVADEVTDATNAEEKEKDAEPEA